MADTEQKPAHAPIGVDTTAVPPAAAAAPEHTISSATTVPSTSTAAPSLAPVTGPAVPGEKVADSAAGAPTTTTTAAAAAGPAAPTTTGDSTSMPAVAPVPTGAVPADPSVEKDASLAQDHPLNALIAKLPDLLKEADYAEVYGVDLTQQQAFGTKLILQKFLRANANDVAKAAEQLGATLKWRKEFQPLKVLEETFSREKFGGLGYVLTLADVPGTSRPEGEKEVVTFNIYGAVKDNQATFGDLQAFLHWRVALMELALSKLALSTATVAIPDYGKGPDPYQAVQVHDYLSISFLRQNPLVKAASKQTIAIFQKYYPETLSRKFFVNVPVVMGWMFGAMKMVLPKETVRKFTVLSYGEGLAAELGKGVPKAYGGEAGELSAIAQEVKFA